MDFEVRRDDLRSVRMKDSETPELEDAEVRLRVSRFALTANNVTYAAFGEAMSYWQFFPAEEGWGRVPVWGFADVVESRVDGLEVGERVYGYLPMSSHLVVTPDRLDGRSFVDATAHRSSLPPVYNQYQRVGAESARDADRERKEVLLRPLFTTSFLLDDWLDDGDMFGAEAVVLTSASSKTALGLAFLLKSRGRTEVVGLTSPRNAEFVRSVGYYDRAVEYGDVADLSASTPTVFVDVAGDGHVLGDVHRHLADSLQRTCLVGATHWEDSTPVVDLPGPTPTFFFAPDQLVKRRADWGSGGLETRVTVAWEAFLESVDGWLQIEEHSASGDLGATWLEVLDGRVSPELGYVLTL